MLVVLSPIFVVDTKIIFVYNSVSPLNVSFLGSSKHHVPGRQITLNLNLVVVRSSLRDSKF